MASGSVKSNKNRIAVKKYGLSKVERLKDKQVIRNLLSTGRRFRRRSLSIIYLPSEEQAAGFVASKRIGGVVKRNRVKRILREAYRVNKDTFKGLKVLLYAHGPLKFDEVVDIFSKFQEGP